MAGLGIIAKGILEKVAAHLAEKKVGEAALSKASEAVGSGQAGGIGIGGGQPSPMSSSAPVSDPTAITGQLGNANTMGSLSPEASSVMSGAQINNPYLDRMTWKNTGIVPNAGQGAYRQEALRDMSEVEFNQYAKQMNASPYEYWTQQMKKDPNNAYNYLNQMFASNETPEQKAKREKSERLGRVFNDLGDVLGNAANLYYASKGGVPVDLESVNEKHRRRMQKIKEKQEALDEQRKEIIRNAKLGEIKHMRAERAAKAKTDAEANAASLKYKRDLTLKEIENAYKLGQIDAETKAKLTEQAAKAASDKELESIKQTYRVALKGMKSGDARERDEKVLTSLTGSDGGTWTRNTQLSKEELRELSKYVEDWSPYTKVDEDGKETIDYLGAIADASDSGLIPDYILEERGFKRSKDSARRKKGGEFSFASQNNGFSFK